MRCKEERKMPRKPSLDGKDKTGRKTATMDRNDTAEKRKRIDCITVV